MEASQKNNKFFFKKYKSILHGYLTKVRVEILTVNGCLCSQFYTVIYIIIRVEIVILHGYLYRQPCRKKYYTRTAD